VEYLAAAMDLACCLTRDHFFRLYSPITHWAAAAEARLARAPAGPVDLAVEEAEALWPIRPEVDLVDSAEVVVVAAARTSATSAGLVVLEVAEAE
jgi:hypothetical protein